MAEQEAKPIFYQIYFLVSVEVGCDFDKSRVADHGPLTKGTVAVIQQEVSLPGQKLIDAHKNCQILLPIAGEVCYSNRDRHVGRSVSDRRLERSISIAQQYADRLIARICDHHIQPPVAVKVAGDDSRTR